MAKKKINPHGPITQISAREFNRHVDVADAWERMSRLGNPGARPIPNPLDLDAVWVTNSTGYDLRQGDPVLIGGVASYGGVDRQYPYFTASAAITTNEKKPWAVALAPIPADGLGKCQLSGAAVCYATISDAVERPYLAPIGTGGILKPSWWGPAEIVYADIATSGERLVLARLGTLQTPIYKAATKASISPGGSGNVGLLYGGTERETLTAHLNWMEGVANISSGVDCLIRWFPDEAKWVIINAEC